MSNPLSIYIHIPFCKRRCNYCDFVTYAGKAALIPDYLNALCIEIELTASRNHVTETVDTIYFGGGTPSILSIDQLATVLDQLRSTFTISNNAEITIEVNPGDCDQAFVAGIRQFGFNRVSLGMQSALDSELVMMGRRHTHADTQNAVASLKTTGFDNISLDLIFGYPCQSLSTWIESIQAALALNPQHISLYALSVEKRTPLAKQLKAGLFQPKEDSYFSDVYAKACELLESASFRHYEISNWSREKIFESRHNSKTWRLEPYLGFGVGAHGYYRGVRTQNLSSINGYIERLQYERKTGGKRFPAASIVRKQTNLEEQQNYLIFGLRQLEEGIDPSAFEMRFGITLEKAFCKPLERLLRQKAIHFQPNGNLVINRELAFVSNQIFVEFI